MRRCSNGRRGGRCNYVLCLPELALLTEQAGGHRLRLVHALSQQAGGDALSWPSTLGGGSSAYTCPEWSTHAGRLSVELIQTALTPLGVREGSGGATGEAASGGGSVGGRCGDVEVEAVVCGPPSLLGAAVRLLREAGCPEAAIHCMQA